MVFQWSTIVQLRHVCRVTTRASDDGNDTWRSPGPRKRSGPTDEPKQDGNHGFFLGNPRKMWV